MWQRQTTSSVECSTTILISARGQEPGAEGTSSMPGVRKNHRIRKSGRAFPASQYDDPRGGRPAALERNVLRYRATEAALYLFYAEEVRDFMLTNVYPQAIKDPTAAPWEPTEERRLEGVLSRILTDAELAKVLSVEDARALRLTFATERQQGKKLKTAFAHAIKIGMFAVAEADEVRELLEYRNDIAHRIHLVMSDVSRSYAAAAYVSFTAPAYKGDALERLRKYRESLWKRTQGRLLLTISMDGMLFELAERTYEAELKRLDRLIQAQIRRELARAKAINAELDLRGTELVDDLDPRFPLNHHHGRIYRDDYVPPTGHLTKRGVEICYRLYDMGKSPIAVAYLMGMSLRGAENRQRGWIKSGGLQRARADVTRYDLDMREKPSGEGERSTGT